MTQGKTLRELDVKEGDVVKCVTSDYKEFGLFTCEEVMGDGSQFSGEHKLTSETFGEGIFNDEAGLWKIHSRAGKPKTWGEMTPEEKGALLLAHHEGSTIEWNHAATYVSSGWEICDTDYLWDNGFMYRVKPEPEVEKVTLRGKNFSHWLFSEGGSLSGDNYAITFDVVDGKPVLDSIGMHPL